MICYMLIINMPLWITVYLQNKWCLNLESWINITDWNYTMAVLVLSAGLTSMTGKNLATKNEMPPRVSKTFVLYVLSKEDEVYCPS